MITLIAVWFLPSCGSKKSKPKENEEIIIEKTDTVVMTDTTTHTITKVIRDTIYITKPGKSHTKKGQPPSLNAWNPDMRKNIEGFVKSVTNKNSKSYVKPSDRIAVFDNEGTMWPEQPVYFQLEFMFDRIKEMAKDHPEWKKDKLIRAVLSGDLDKIRKFGGEGLYRLSEITQSGMTTDEYNKIVLDWINTAKHPTTGKLYKDMVYLPMKQLIDYLKYYDFKVYLVTEGGSGFLRPWVAEVYGIPPENVLASRRKLSYEEKDGKHVLIRQPEIEYINNNVNKVITIQQLIGKRPVMAIGNSDSDIPMLEWTSERNGKSFVAVIHHTDDKREWAYDKNSKIGKLARGLREAQEKDWFVVDMKNDWNKIYPN